MQYTSHCTQCQTHSNFFLFVDFYKIVYCIYLLGNNARRKKMYRENKNENNGNVKEFLAVYVMRFFNHTLKLKSFCDFLAKE